MQSMQPAGAMPTTYAEAKVQHAQAVASANPDQIALAYAAMTDLYFRENTDKGYVGKEVVTRAYVVDPDTGIGDHAAWLTDNSAVVLVMSGRRFDGEARHVAQWAAGQGFLMQWQSVTVAV